MRAIIIEDDSNATNDLKDKLKKHKYVEIVGNASFYDDGIKLLEEKNPDILFLDIEMPGKNGFDVIEWMKVNKNPRPYVIFVTGYDKFVLKALREGALDYLLKPVKEDELESALTKVQGEIARAQQVSKLESLLRYVNGQRIMLPSSLGFIAINSTDIIYIERNTQKDRIELIMVDNKRQSLTPGYNFSKLMSVLPAGDFFQIDRGLIVNTYYIAEIHSSEKVCIVKKNDFSQRLEVARRRWNDFLKFVKI